MYQNDMAKKIGIPHSTLSEIINVHKEREEQKLTQGVTTGDIRENIMRKFRGWC